MSPELVGHATGNMPAISQAVPRLSMNKREPFQSLMSHSPRAEVSRRDWNRMALALAMSPWLTPAAQAQSLTRAAGAAQGPRWQADPFGLGVASGQPQPDSVVLWTRLLIADADAALQPVGENPVAAGVGEMKYRNFLKYNFIGVLVWASGVTLIGAGLGQIPLFREHVEIVTLVFFTISWIPIITEVLKARRERRN